MPDELLRPTIGAGVDLSVRPWRLMSQTYVAFFGGVISATVIAFLNARRLGVAPDKRRLILLVGGIGLLLAAVVISLLTTDSTTSAGIRVAIRVVAVATCLVQLRIQRPMDRAFQLRAGEYGSLWGPGIAAVIGGGLIEAILLAIVAIAL
jgi:hypothetical protein